VRRIAYEAALLRIQRDARSAATRLAAAQEARQSGDTRLAGRLLRVLLSHRRTPPPYRAVARTALGEMREEAEQRMTELENRLATSGANRPPSADRIANEVMRILDESSDEAPRVVSRDDAGSAEPPGSTVVETFEQMDELLWQYETVPGVARGLRARLGRLRRDERYAVLLKEPEAAALWKQGQRHETADEPCCAYLAYERAARLLPARSARRAAMRLEEIAADPQIVASVARCRRLRQCHKTFQLGELFAKAGRVAQARASFEEVVAAAPTDSTVHAAALDQLRRLGADG
jgi:hypothetical protein